MSDEKCSASASSASLEVFRATRFSARARLKSMMMEPAMIATAHQVTSTSWLSPPSSLLRASHTIQPVVTKSRAVSTRAATLSILAWP